MYRYKVFIAFSIITITSFAQIETRTDSVSKNSMNFSYGVKGVFPNGNLGKMFNPGADFAFTMDINIDRLYTSFNVDIGKFKPKNTFTYI